MHSHSHRRRRLKAAHFEGDVVLAHHALDHQVGPARIEHKRLQEVEAVKRGDTGMRSSLDCASGGARQLEVARTWEHDAPHHHVVGDQSAQHTRGGRAEEASVFRGRQMLPL